MSATSAKRIQWLDPIESNARNKAHGTNKDTLYKSEEYKCNNIIKKYRNWLTMLSLQKKKQSTI